MKKLAKSYQREFWNFVKFNNAAAIISSFEVLAIMILVCKILKAFNLELISCTSAQLGIATSAIIIYIIACLINRKILIHLAIRKRKREFNE